MVGVRKGSWARMGSEPAAKMTKAPAQQCCHPPLPFGRWLRGGFFGRLPPCRTLREQPSANFPAPRSPPILTPVPRARTMRDAALPRIFIA